VAPPLFPDDATSSDEYGCEKQFSLAGHGFLLSVGVPGQQKANLHPIGSALLEIEDCNGSDRQRTLVDGEARLRWD
jgi:hypothetical protein